MDSCPFCAIVAHESEAYLLYEDDESMAFLDRNPANPGHTLVVPRSHQAHLLTDDRAITRAVFETVRRVAMAIDETVDPDGVSLFYTSADLVGHVTHAHVHLLPRYADDAIQLALTRHSLDETEAERLTASIRDQL